MDQKTTKPVSELKNWDRNPRQIDKKDFERLKRQIKRLGQYKPLLITEDNVVIGGNMRLRAYIDLGIAEAWVSVVPAKTPKEILEYALSDNDRAGSYDEELLAELLTEQPDFNLEDYRVDLGKLTDLKDLLSKFGPDPDEDEVPELDENVAFSKEGEVYQLGPHRLMCGSATSQSDMDKLMDGVFADLVFADLVFADPPYNIAYSGGEGKKRKAIANDSMSTEQFAGFLGGAIDQLMKHTSDEAGFYICMSPKEMGTLKIAYEANGGHWQSFIIWVKNTFTLSGSDYQHQYEPILYGYKEGKHHYFVTDRNNADVIEDLEVSKPRYDGTTTYLHFAGFELQLDGKVTGKIIRKKQESNIWRHDKPVRSDDHPTMKPISLVVQALRNSSRIGDNVLDSFAGSGTTLMACQKTDRINYSMELDPHYCDVIRKRYAKAVGEEDAWQEATPKTK